MLNTFKSHSLDWVLENDYLKSSLCYGIIKYCSFDPDIVVVFNFKNDLPSARFKLVWSRSIVVNRITPCNVIYSVVLPPWCDLRCGIAGKTRVVKTTEYNIQVRISLSEVGSDNHSLSIENDWRTVPNIPKSRLPVPLQLLPFKKLVREFIPRRSSQSWDPWFRVFQDKIVEGYR